MAAATADQVALLVDSESKADIPVPASKESMRAIFDKQEPVSLKLRVSTARERIAKIKKLQNAVLAYKEDIYKAGYADFRKVGLLSSRASLSTTLSLSSQQLLKHVYEFTPFSVPV